MRQKIADIMNIGFSVFSLFFLYYLFRGNHLMECLAWGASFTCKGLSIALDKVVEERQYGVLTATAGAAYMILSVLSVMPQMGAYDKYFDFGETFTMVLLVVTFFHEPIERLTEWIKEEINDIIND